MNPKEAACKALEDRKIPYRRVEHPAVFTVEEMRGLDFPKGAVIAKNLFLRDAKGKRHFLVTADAGQAIDLRRLESALNSTRLSFASDERLQKHLGLTKGSVGPLGLLNDTERRVEFYLDAHLCDSPAIGIHPNDNTATVFVSGQDLRELVRATGHEVNLIHFAE